MPSNGKSAKQGSNPTKPGTNAAKNGTNSAKPGTNSQVETRNKAIEAGAHYAKAVNVAVLHEAISNDKVDAEILANELLDKDFQVSPASLNTEDIQSLPTNVAEIRTAVTKICNADGKPCEGLDVIGNAAGEIGKLGQKLPAKPEELFKDGTALHAVMMANELKQYYWFTKQHLVNLRKHLENGNDDPNKSLVASNVRSAIENLLAHDVKISKNLSRVDIGLIKNETIKPIIDQMILFDSLPEYIQKLELNLVQSKIKSIQSMIGLMSPYYTDEQVKRIKVKLMILSNVTDAPKFPTTKKVYTPGLIKGAKDLDERMDDFEKQLIELLLTGKSNSKLRLLSSTIKHLHDEFQAVLYDSQRLERTAEIEREINQELTGVRTESNKLKALLVYNQCLPKIAMLGEKIKLNGWKKYEAMFQQFSDKTVSFVNKCKNQKVDLNGLSEFYETVRDQDATQFLENIDNYDDAKKRKLIETLEAIEDKLESLVNDDDSKPLSEFQNLINKSKKSFKDPDVSSGLTCLKQKSLHDQIKTLASTNSLGDALKKYQSNSKIDVELKKIANTVLSLIKNYKKFTNSMKNKKLKQERKASKIQNGFKVTKDLSLAIKQLHDTMKADASKEHLEELMKKKALIDKDIEKLKNSDLKTKLMKLWSPESKKSLETLPTLINEMNQQIKASIKQVEDLAILLNNTISFEKMKKVDMKSLMEGFRDAGINHVDPKTMKELESLDLEFTGSKTTMKDGLKAFFETLPFFTETDADEVTPAVSLKSNNFLYDYWPICAAAGCCLFIALLAWYMYNLCTSHEDKNKYGTAFEKSLFCCLKKKKEEVKPPDVKPKTVKEKPVKEGEDKFYKGKGGRIYSKQPTVSTKAFKSTVMEDQPKEDKEVKLSPTEELVVKEKVKQRKKDHATQKDIHKKFSEDPGNTRNVCFRDRTKAPRRTFDSQNTEVSSAAVTCMPPTILYNVGKKEDIFEHGVENPLPDIQITDEDLETTMKTAQDVSEMSKRIVQPKESELKIDVTQDESTREPRSTAAGDEPPQESWFYFGQVQSLVGRFMAGSDDLLTNRRPVLTKWLVEVKKVMNYYFDRMDKFDFGKRNFVRESAKQCLNGKKVVKEDGELDYDLIEKELNKKEVVHHEGCPKNGERTYKPLFSHSISMKAVRDGISKFQKDDAVVILNRKKIRVYGDIHGALDDFCRSVELGYYDSETTYLFLGDYVDRGPNSVATVVTLCMYKAMYPDTFFFLRGNHESHLINAANHGFLEECIRVYGEKNGKEFYSLANEMFKELPVAAIVNDKSWFSHGGLSPHMLNGRDYLLKMLKKIPTTEEEMQLLLDILWSDPSPVYAVDGKEPILFAKSTRSNDSVNFTVHGMLRLMKECGFEFMGRGHQCKDRGFEFFCGTKGVTLFGRTNNDKSGNMASQMILHEDNKCEFILFKNLDENKYIDEDEETMDTEEEHIPKDRKNNKKPTKKTPKNKKNKKPAKK